MTQIDLGLTSVLSLKWISTQITFPFGSSVFFYVNRSRVMFDTSVCVVFIQNKIKNSTLTHWMYVDEKKRIDYKRKLVVTLFIDFSMRATVPISLFVCTILFYRVHFLFATKYKLHVLCFCVCMCAKTKLMFRHGLFHPEWNNQCE